MEQKPQFWKSAMHYGLYLGLVLVVFNTIINAMGNSGKFLGWIQWVIITAGVYISQYQFRNSELNGFISYSKCLKLGIVVMMCASIFVSLHTFVHINYIDPDYLEKMKIEVEEVMLQNNIPEDKVEAMSESFSIMRTPGMIIFSGLLGFAFFGFIISLITSIFIMKNDDNNAFERDMKGIED